MTFNQTSSIRFSVEESVWFKRGQEVSDLIGISLEPEIAVQEHESYISIRGALVLTGEYHPQTRDGEEEINSLRDSAIYRTVDEVIKNDDGNLAMKHRFPIDITIPTNRIRSLEEVYVLIESFDYEIPETGRLELKADLCISGIANERDSSLAAQRQNEIEQEPQDVRGELGVQKDQVVQEFQAVNWVQDAVEERQAFEELQSESSQPSSVIEDVTNNDGLGSTFRQKVLDTFKKTQVESEKEEENTYPSFTTEVRKQVDENEPADENVAEGTESPVDSERVEVNLTLVDQADELELAERPIVAEAEIGDALAAEEDAEAVAEEAAIPVNIVAKKRSPQIGMKGRSEKQEQGWNPRSLYGAQHATYNTSGARENVQADADNEAAQQKRSKRTENALYLTKMLSSDGEADFSKLRLRIVQNGETLGTIAKTYDISTNQIIRLNALDDEAVKEGQILYIPAYAGVEK